MQLVTLFTKVDDLHRQVSSVELQPSKSASARQLEAQSEDEDTTTDPIRDRPSRLSQEKPAHTRELALQQV